MRSLALTVLVACAAAPPAPAQVAGAVTQSGHPPAPIVFDDDPKIAADWRDDSIESREAATLHKGSYASARGGRVPAILVEPATAGDHHAALVFVHWGEGNRTELLPDAIALAAKGVVSLLLTAPSARPRLMRSPTVTTDREEYLQAVVDTRRAIDLLLARADVDPQRLGFVGHSFGAHVGGIVAGVDGRPHAYVLMAGVASLTDFMRTTPDVAVAAARAATPPAEWERYLATMAPLDAKNFTAKARPMAFLLQYARDDEVVPPAEAETYRGAVAGPAELHWYDGGHELNDPRAAADRRAWLLEHL
jgi:cephalosporin-C deacetylase-like acetyl esterase